MDNQLSTGAIAGIIAVVVLVLGFVAWRMFGNHGPSPEQLQNAQQGVRQDYMRRMGGGPPGGAPGPQ